MTAKERRLQYNLRPWKHALPLLQADVMGRYDRSRYRSHWHERVAAQLLEAGHRKTHPLWSELELTYERHSSGRRPDYANIVYSAKPIVDGLIGLLIEDDDDSHIPMQTYRHVACSRNEQGVLLELRRLA